MADDAATPTPRRNFFAARYAGEVPLERVFWIDMLVVATLINIGTALLGILMFGFKLPAWVGVAAFLSPLPYNLFLYLAVWRASAKVEPKTAAAYRLAAAVWVGLSILI